MQTVVAEESADLLVEPAEGTELHQFQRVAPRAGEVERRVEVGVDERRHLCLVQLLEPVAELDERRRFYFVGESGNLFGHRFATVPHEQLAAIFVDRAVHRVDFLDLHVVGHIRAGGVERIFEQIRHGEHGRAVVEAESVRCDEPSSSARNVVAFKQRHVVAASCEVGSGRQAAESGADHHHVHVTITHVVPRPDCVWLSSHPPITHEVSELH